MPAVLPRTTARTQDITPQGGGQAHSQGGGLALTMATRRPDLLKAVVAVEPSGAPHELPATTACPAYLMVWGDHVHDHPVWKKYRARVDEHQQQLSSMGAQAETLESYRVGSVAWSMKYFPEGQWSNSAFKAAEIAAKAVLDEAQMHYPRHSWDTCYGSSGTVGAVADVLTQAGWPEGLITREGLDWLKEKLLKAQKPEFLKLEGIKEDRRPVIGGGLAVLRAVCDLLHIDEMFAAQGA